MDGRLQGMKIVDVDTHITETWDLWVSRAPAKWKDRVPQVQSVDGKPRWMIDGTPMGLVAQAASVVRKDGSKAGCAEVYDMTLETVHPASYEPEARVKMMDEAGIWAQIGYPNLLGFGGHRAAGLDPDLKLMCVQIYNDAMAEFQERSGQRIFPMALLPWWDVPASITEAERTKNLGLRGVNMSSSPQDHKLPDLGTPHWDPLWAACGGLGLPVNFHIGASDDTISWFGSSPWPSLNLDQKVALGSAMLAFTNGKVLANLIYSGVPERHPNVKFVSVESGIGWLPFLLEILDYQANETRPGSMDALSMKPSDYFKRQFYGCFWFEQRDLAASVRTLGVNNVMFETDFPHPTCFYPNPIERIAPALGDLDAESCQKIFSSNAAHVYSLPV